MTGGIYNLLQMILVSINYSALSPVADCVFLVVPLLCDMLNSAHNLIILLFSHFRIIHSLPCVCLLCNADDWSTMVGNPTKLGLSLLTLVFNFVFIFQHYFLYSDRACCSYGGRGQPIYENFTNESHSIDPEAAAGDSDNPTFRPLDDSDEQIRRMNLKKSLRKQMAAQSDHEANPPADGTGSSLQQQQQQQQVKLQSAASDEQSAPSQQASAAPPTLPHVMIVDETRLAAGATADGSSAATNQNPTFPDNSQRSISARDPSLQ